jgi:hypothetical protein
VVTLRPTADQQDFARIPGLVEAWSQYLSDAMEFNIYGVPGDRYESAVEQLKKWGRSDADLRFYNPLSMAEPAGSESRNVNWKALPTSFDDRFGSDRQRLYTFLDNPDQSESPPTRIQDEYCEWVVHRDQATGKISRVIFTSEPEAYYEFLFSDPYQVGRDRTQALLLDLYRERCDGQQVSLDDLRTPDGRRYNAYNKWNNQYAVHMQQKNNTLFAQVNIAAISAVLRQDRAGNLISNSQKLIGCGGYGEGSRQSDPTIGSAVNTFARENRFVTLEDPVGLYMTGLDTQGWATPDGSSPASYWTAVKGRADADPDKAMIVRAEYAVPSEAGFTVSDVTIGGSAIRFGAQIAAKVNMRLGVRVSPPATFPAPRAIGCRNERPVPLADFRPEFTTRGSM